MDNFLGSLGAAGLAGALCVILWFGTQPGGKVKPLGWGASFVLAMIAGASFKAAGTPFDLISSLINDAIGMFGDAFPGYSMAGLALTMAAFIAYKKLTTRQVAYCGVAFWYIASGAGGGWTILADKIALIMNSLAS